MIEVSIDEIIKSALNNESVKIIVGGLSLICAISRVERKTMAAHEHQGFMFEFIKTDEVDEVDEDGYFDALSVDPFGACDQDTMCYSKKIVKIRKNQFCWGCALLKSGPHLIKKGSYVRCDSMLVEGRSWRSFYFCDESLVILKKKTRK